MEVFEVDIFNLAKEWDHTDTFYKVSLHDEFIECECRYVCTGYVSEDDKAMGEKEVVSDAHFFIKRDSFISVEKRWLEKSNCWTVELEANGYPNSIQFYYQDKNLVEANKIFKLIKDWVFNLE